MAFYKSNRGFAPGQGLPKVSKDLDSVRSYQWEVVFRGLDSISLLETNTTQDSLTLAAKKVTGLEISVENKTVDRVNDRLNYPGKATLGEMVVTFDNLYNERVAAGLFNWFQTIYDPLTGEQTKFTKPGGTGIVTGSDNAGTFKVNEVDVILLSNTADALRHIKLYGVYPTKYAATELNYSTSDFHTVEMSFKYDFMTVHEQDEVPTPTPGGIPSLISSP